MANRSLPPASWERIANSASASGRCAAAAALKRSCLSIAEEDSRRRSEKYLRSASAKAGLTSGAFAGLALGEGAPACCCFEHPNPAKTMTRSPTAILRWAAAKVRRKPNLLRTDASEEPNIATSPRRHSVGALTPNVAFFSPRSCHAENRLVNNKIPLVGAPSLPDTPYSWLSLPMRPQNSFAILMALFASSAEGGAADSSAAEAQSRAATGGAASRGGKDPARIAWQSD